MSRHAVSQMLGAIILIAIAIVLVGALLVYSYLWSASGRITSARGVSIACASLAALPGGSGYLRTDITNTGGVTGSVSIALYSSSGWAFSTQGPQIASGQVVGEYYVIRSGIASGSTYTVVVILSTPRGATAASVTLVAGP